ncbi:MAG: hypothetical protein KDD67_10980 [Ignavibacteriae bacterium]|nr:hypothetical protein [Ignavibacteriota bacterium]MCB9215813.1 hypothetical protein [Ignavibacteria bacterium]
MNLEKIKSILVFSVLFGLCVTALDVLWSGDRDWTELLRNIAAGILVLLLVQAANWLPWNRGKKDGEKESSTSL